MNGSMRFLGLLFTFAAVACSQISSAEDLVSRVSGTDCSTISNALVDPSLKAEIDSAAGALNRASALRYITGADSLFGDYYAQLEQRAFVSGLSFSDKLKVLKQEISSNDQRLYLTGVRQSLEAHQKQALSKFWGRQSTEIKYAKLASDCAMKALAEGTASGSISQLKTLIRNSKGVTRHATVGYFDASVDACNAQSLPITGNKYTEPDAWDGSRFVVLDVTFKNNDSEGRLPLPGSLVINHNGRELTYDTTESIMQKGFGIYFKSVNPLLSMKTKLVYRIPNEISGDVFWVPGRNEDQKRLWCTTVKALD